ncbi:MAG: hypothetical protein AB4063_25000 [Crocosphaera sp.]
MMDSNMTTVHTSRTLDSNDKAAKDIEDCAPSEKPPIERRSEGRLEEIKSRIRESQESTRSNLAIALFTAYTVTTVCVLLIASLTQINQEDRKEIVLLIITSQVTLMGSALGFYFGKEN